MTPAEALALIQRSPQWFEACIGSIGASSVHDIIAKGKAGEPSASRKNLLARIVVETLTGKSASSGYKSPAMDQGTEREPETKREYTFMTGNEIVDVGMVMHPTIPHTHASLDGIIGEDGFYEGKAPEAAEHMRMLLGGKIKAQYETQVTWGFACSGRQWCDWVSFNPDFPVEMQLLRIHILRDPTRIVELEGEVRRFMREVDEAVARLKAAYP